MTTNESATDPEYLTISQTRFLVQYSLSAICVFILLGTTFFWLRSFSRVDSIRYRYSEVGELTFLSIDGSFSLGQQDARFLDNERGWKWYVHDRVDLTDTHISTSLAGFGWESHALSRKNQLNVRYWVPFFFVALVATLPWQRRRYSLGTLFVAMTVICLMVGFSAAAHRQERLQRESQRFKIVAEYDYGTFSSDFPAQFARALEMGTQLELLSLHPMEYEATPENNFHGWKVLGRTPVDGGAARARLIASFRAGINRAEEGSDCFDPRHAIRLNHGGKYYDFVICFECENVRVYIDNKRHESFCTTYTPQPVFDELLTTAGVELAPSAYE